MQLIADTSLLFLEIGNLRFFLQWIIVFYITSINLFRNIFNSKTNPPVFNLSEGRY